MPRLTRPRGRTSAPGIDIGRSPPAPATENPQGAPLRAALAASQVLGMALCRYILAFSPLVDMERQEVIDWIGPTLQRYLTG